MTSRRGVSVLVGLTLVLLLAACGGGDGNSSVSSRDQAGTTTTPPDNSSSADGYVGLTKAAAIAKAEAAGHPWRISA